MMAIEKNTRIYLRV